MFQVIPIETPKLGDRSYLVHDGREAFVIDPQRDIDRVLELAEQFGVHIGHVFETHIHNDYVTGGLALAAATGARYYVNIDDDVAFDRSPISDGDIVAVSSLLSVTAVATPGHTHTHLAYLLDVGGRQTAAFTGGSLLFGATGRPDLLGAEHTGVLVREQHRSARRLAAKLPDEAGIFPTHGFGSFCSAKSAPTTDTGGTASTIGREKTINPALTKDEQAYVDEVLAGLDAFPAYYAHMGAANLAGPAAPDLSAPRRADAAELRRRLEGGEWLVDLRCRTAFAAGHLAGALNFGLDGSFATYLGWLIPWGTPVSLLGDSVDQVAEAQRELVRIGIERPAAAATGSPQAWSDGFEPATLRTASFRDLAAIRGVRGVGVLDVRRRLEWEESHIAGAVHIPLQELLSRSDEVPSGEVWVHCEAGYRASIAASMLAAAGHDVVAVDDEFAHARSAGLELISGRPDEYRGDAPNLGGVADA